MAADETYNDIFEQRGSYALSPEDEAEVDDTDEEDDIDAEDEDEADDEDDLTDEDDE